MWHHSHVIKKNLNCSSCCFRNVEPACILFLFFVSWSLGHEADVSHTPCSADGCSWSHKAVQQQGKNTHKLGFYGKFGVTGHLLNSLQETASSFYSSGLPVADLTSEFWKPFQQAIIWGGKIVRAEAQSDFTWHRAHQEGAPQSSQGLLCASLGSGAHPGPCTAAHFTAGQGMTPSLQNNLLLVLGVPVPGEQSSSATGHSEAMQSPSLEIFKTN